MKKVIAALTLGLSLNAWAAKGYQVTGPVVEATDSKIVIMKDKERWELAKSAATKVTGGEIKVGDKVTVYYNMSATEVEVKADKKKK